MAPRAKELPADHGMLESEKVVARIKADLETLTATLAEQEGRLSVVALDSLADPKAFEALEAQITTERSKARQLTAALAEAERRVQVELAEIRYRNERARIEKVLKHFAARDQAGAEVEAAVKVLADKFRALVVAGEKVRSSAGGLLPVDVPGFLVGAGELEDVLANQFHKASAGDISARLNGVPGRIDVLPSLPGSKPILRTGAAMPYTPADAPALTVRLAESTEFARQIMAGERTYRGEPTPTPPQSEWVWPGRDPATLEAYKARGRGTVPLDGREATAGAEPRGAIAEAAQRALNAITGHAAEGPAGTGPQMLPGEAEIEFAKRLAATPVAPLTDAEREALNRPPTGPTKTAAEVMSAMVGGRRTTIHDEAVGRKRKDGDEW